MPEKEKIYQFEGFTFRVKEYILKKGKDEISLRPKTQETLLYLVEHRGKLVKKDDILDNVWFDSVVTENTLTQCIKEIREKLGDNSANPLFIKTIPRLGYKFIAPVQEIISGQDSQVRKWTHYSNFLFRTRTGIAGLVVLMILLAGVLFYFLAGNKPGFTFSERNWALITNIDNHTGEEDFESALRTALEMGLSESKYVNVVPRGRVQDILNLMKKDPNSKINRELGREISIRDGNIQVLLTGSIYKIGDTYSFSLEVIEPVKNRIVKTFSREVNSKKGILPAIRYLTVSVRKALGENMNDFPKNKKSFERVTTPSLKALRYYSKGVDYLNVFDFDRARYFFNQAIRDDTSFAMAYLLSGFAEMWQSNLSDGKLDFEKAAKLSTDLSEKEKYFILGVNAIYNKGDPKKGIKYYELLLDIYPDYYWGNENLSLAYLWKGNIKKYRKYKSICEKLRPNYFINYSEKGLFSLYYDRNINKADSAFSRALELKPDFPFEFPYLSGAFLDWMNDDLDSAEIKMSRFLFFRIKKLLPMAQITSRWYVSHFFLYTGRYDEVIKLLKQSISMSEQQPTGNLLPWSQMELALVYLEMGKTKQFGSIINNVINSTVGIVRVQALGWLAIHNVRTGQPAMAKKLLDDIEREDRLMPTGIVQSPLPDELTRAKLAFANQIKGEIAYARKDYKPALDYFNKVVELVPYSQLPALTALSPRIRWVALTSRAHIYEITKYPELAIASYKDILNEKVLIITSPAASGIWVNSLLSLSEVLNKQGKHKMAEGYQAKYTDLRSDHATNKED